MKTEYIPAWQEEIDRFGLKNTLLSRLEFHGGLSLSWTTRMTGVAQNTIKKHLNNLVETGNACRKVLDGDFHYRFTQQ